MMLQKFGVNPKPTKRPMRAILDTNNEEEEEEEPPKQLQKARSSQEGILRPSRTAKAKANANLVITQLLTTFNFSYRKHFPTERTFYYCETSER